MSGHVAEAVRAKPAAQGLAVLALVRSNELKNALTAALADRRGFALEVQVGELKAGNGALMERLGKADILFLDVDVGSEHELATLRRIADEHRGRAPILASTHDLTGPAVRQLIRQGIDDFVPQPVQAQDVVDALDDAARKVRQLRQGGRARGKVLGFIRGKGGMGATTLALHTALVLQRPPARRAAAPRVCVLDLDLQFGDAGLYLDLEPRQEMLEIIRSPQRFDGTLLRGAMVQHQSGLSVLPAPLEPVPLEALRMETAGQLLEAAREEFDYVVVDLPLALAGWVGTVLGRLDQLFVVTQLNVPAIRQTRRLLDLMQEESLFNIPLAIVLNRWVWRLTERGRLKQAVTALGRPVDHYIPDAAGLALEAANRGLPIYDVRRHSRLGRAIATMAQDCAKRLAQPATTTVQAP
ncbi:MAG TPA: AAA family ATPase [Geminicoccaceae bacterium]|nr:AAA family ATPase [Geminicoccaceae bacterium]